MIFLETGAQIGKKISAGLLANGAIDASAADCCGIVRVTSTKKEERSWSKVQKKCQK
jgi:hypothetical protein